MRRIRMNRRSFIPRLRSQKVVNILNTIISPDPVMHALPPLRLQGIVDVRKRGPAALENL